MLCKALAVLFVGGACALEAALDEVPVATGVHHSLFIEPLSGGVLAVGSNRFGQLGNRQTEDATCTPVPVELPKDVRFVAVAAGSYHSLFLSEDGELYVAGRNQHGQLGDGTKDNRNEPMMVQTGVRKISAGYAHSVVLTVAGKVATTGVNSQGQLCDGTTTSRSSFQDTASPDVNMTAEHIAAGYDFTVFRSSSGSSFGCGNNLGGQIGLGDALNAKVWTQIDVPMATESVGLSAGWTHTYFMGDGKVQATGANFAGQLADGTETLRRKPVEVAQDMDGVFVGGDSTCFVRDTDILCAGSNRHGQVGLGDTEMAVLPTLVPGSRDHAFKTVSVGSTHGLYVTGHDKVYVSGMNWEGELGLCNISETRNLVPSIKLNSSATTMSTTMSTTTTVTTSTATSTTTISTSMTTSVTMTKTDPPRGGAGDGGGDTAPQESGFFTTPGGIAVLVGGSFAVLGVVITVVAERRRQAQVTADTTGTASLAPPAMIAEGDGAELQLVQSADDVEAPAAPAVPAP